MVISGITNFKIFRQFPYGREGPIHFNIVSGETGTARVSSQLISPVVRIKNTLLHIILQYE